MTSRPTPLELPQDTRAFVDAIANLTDHIAALDEKTATLETKIIEESAANRNLLAQMKDKDMQIIEATVTARLAQQASLPTLLTWERLRRLLPDLPPPPDCLRSFPTLT
ncbi:uncharacterized protein J7T54_007649, partial [Emericellopsis cladophorae]